MSSLNLGKKKSAPTAPAKQKENPDLATIWIFTVLCVGGVAFLLLLFGGRFANIDALAAYLLAWGCMIGLVPIPLWTQKGLAKLPPGVISGTIKICVGLGLALYVMATFLFCLVAADAITWRIFLTPGQVIARVLEIIIQGNFGSPVR
jgi:hypothetical protein